MYNITAVCEEVNAANNIKLVTFIAIRAVQFKTENFFDAHHNEG